MPASQVGAETHTGTLNTCSPRLGEALEVRDQKPRIKKKKKKKFFAIFIQKTLNMKKSKVSVNLKLTTGAIFRSKMSILFSSFYLFGFITQAWSWWT